MASSVRRWGSDSERGETLVEVLIAIVVIGICAVALLGGLTTTLSSSGEHRSLAADDSVAVSLADQVKSVIQLQSNAKWPGGSTGDCPSSGTLLSWYQNTSNVPIPATFTSAPFTGYGVVLTTAWYWNGSSWVSGSSCPFTGSTSPTGVQMVEITVTAPNSGPSRKIDVVVRKLSDGLP